MKCTNVQIAECEFKFKSLKHHLGGINSDHGFCAEDCTNVVKKISYDRISNSFIGFCTPLNNGVPQPIYFETDNFYTLENWFKTAEKSSLLNFHMIQPITSNLSQSAPFILYKQNFTSCLKISSKDVLSMLTENSNTTAIRFCLTIIHLTILAYIDKTISVSDRIYFAWITAFMCQFWYMWIQCNSFNTHSFAPRNNSKTAVKNKKRDKTKFFITKPMFFSIELNAHNLTYLTMQVMNKQLPPESLNIYLFSSQSREATFRNCRALPGTFSSSTNFNVQEFIKRSEKLAVLSEIKTYEN
ncbi:unnamed protein product [Didymodactylos carnosus]|uniref:Uncharacterized protein n=1 Tax=Didymodactylos carnosus TaxID=1234261 RepID=A0A815ANH3_9BILA|nr:unnamed protein product [Didymodactylos carnosus]CAF1356868.1 unnamed protein product [Didymodactylos carnosus]CAF4037156.1 unnamed protein product [Didymodactylos carnosus]CAF4167031.1 unnamed protein product [Didymodactylos carnosus]